MRVMVVEDVPDVALTFAGLIRACGHRAQVAHDGESALKMAREFQPQMVFLDIRLPDMSGYEVAERMRTIEGLGTSRLISVSGYGEDQSRAKDAGFDMHLPKPVSMDSLLAILNC